MEDSPAGGNLAEEGIPAAVGGIPVVAEEDILGIHQALLASGDIRTEVVGEASFRPA